MIPKLHNFGFFINSCLELIASLLEKVTGSFWENDPVEDDCFDVMEAVTTFLTLLKSCWIVFVVKLCYLNNFFLILGN